MPADTGDDIHEVLIAPLPLLLGQTAVAVSEAQLALDDAALRTTQRLAALRASADPDRDPSGLSAADLEAPWYHLPEVEVEIAMSLRVQVRTETRPDGRRVRFPFLAAVPRNAGSRRTEDTTAAGTSRLRARITAVPPPPSPAPTSP